MTINLENIKEAILRDPELSGFDIELPQNANSLAMSMDVREMVGVEVGLQLACIFEQKALKEGDTKTAMFWAQVQCFLSPQGFESLH